MQPPFALRLASMRPAMSVRGDEAQPDVRAEILTPPPRSQAPFVSYLQPDDSAIGISRNGLANYSKWYREGGDAALDGLKRAYPLRARFARHSGFPAYLTGLLDAPPNLKSDETYPIQSDCWLVGYTQDGQSQAGGAGDLVGQALFGVAEPRVLWDGRLVRDRTMRLARPGLENNASALQHAHVSYQQYFDRRPVFGGRVVVHLTDDDRRISASNSFFPIPEQYALPEKTLLSPEAVQVAEAALLQMALDGLVEDRFALVILDKFLVSWLAGPSAGSAANDSRFRALLAMFRETLARWAGDGFSGLPETDPMDPMTWLRMARHLMLKRGLAPLREGIVEPYREHEAFIYPFAGRYYLAYRVVFVTEWGDGGWRVFVNADARPKPPQVLGWPEPITVHAPLLYYENSDDALSNTTSVWAPAANALDFCELKWHPDTGLNAAAVPVATLGNTAASAALDFEMTNVAFHTQDTWDLFVSLSGQPDSAGFRAQFEDPARRAGPQFDILIGMSATGWTTGFAAPARTGVAPRGVVTFETGIAPAIGAKPRGNLSKDPDVVRHEITHVLMWLLNSEPFEMSAETHPFARALVEGYADYFARVRAVRKGDSDTVPWARAAYAAFTSRYDPAHPYVTASGALTFGNQLARPNLYPALPTSDEDTGLTFPPDVHDMQLYDVGMVWVRALWEIRQSLTTLAGNAADNQAYFDQVVYGAYYYMPGWLADFEAVAEGILDCIDRDKNIRPAIAAAAPQYISCFAQRQIQAGRGVQALAEAAGRLWAGTDCGVWWSDDHGSRWYGPESPGAPGGRVIALTVDSGTGDLYAGVQGTFDRGGVYRWDGAAWQEQGQWPDQQTLLCLGLAHNGNAPASAGRLLAGAAQGVWFDANAGAAVTSWQPLESAVTDLILDLASAHRNFFEHIYAATFSAPLRRVAFAVNPVDQPVNPVYQPHWALAASVAEAQAMGATTAVTLFADAGAAVAYMGTYAAGVWQKDLATDGPWGRIDPVGGPIAGNTILCLRRSGNMLYVGTTAGLFVGTLAGGAWNWTFEHPTNTLGQPVVDGILCLQPASGDVLLVGTASRGLWVRSCNAGGATVWSNWPAIGG